MKFGALSISGLIIMVNMLFSPISTKICLRCFSQIAIKLEDGGDNFAALKRKGV